MGVAIPQIITEDRASGALVVDGSLRFTGSSYLKRTPGSTGNTTTYTISCWVKRSHLAPDGSGNTNSNSNPIFSAGTNAGSDTDDLQFYKDAGNNNAIRFVAYPGAFRFDLSTSMVFRDVSSWYHILANYDGTTAKIYINGTQVTAFASSTQNGGAGNINTTDQHVIGASCDGSTSVFRGYISQFYFIDGQALDSSYFGYTDALTNTWRPKKLSSSVAFGTNGFFLPFDGSAPIGQDQSGRGNNWTPVNFGGSNTLEKATGALPILNTDGGGKVARVGVRTDSYFANLKLAVPFVGVATDVVQQINGNSAAMSSFTANNATFAVHPTDGAPYGTGLYLNSVSDYPNINYAAGTFNFLHNQTGSGTVEFWMYNGAFSTEASMVMGISGSPDVGFGVQMASSTTLQAIISRGVGGSARNSGTANISQNTWSHIAVTKTINGSNAELKLYVNGVLSASNTSITASDLSNSNSTYSYFRIGQNIGDETARGWTNYYMNDLRIYDTVKYTQNFIPASTDPDILPDTPSGVSYTSNLTQITDGAVAFDGSGDYLSLPNDDTNFRLTGDFTIELFVYAPTISASSGYAYVIDYAANGSDGWGITFYNNQLFAFFDYGANGPNAWGPSSSTQLNANQWYHIAWTRQSNVHYYYINGKKYTGATQSFSAPSSSSSNVLNIGRFINNSSYFTGLISNIHVVNGTAIYTTDFTPPTGPISSVANTKLLCCKSNSSATAFDVSPGTITANGNAAATNFNPFTVNINTQRGQESGYATWNPLQTKILGAADAPTLSDGNLTVAPTSNVSGSSVAGTIGVSSGKYYIEYTHLLGADTNDTFGFGIRRDLFTGNYYDWEPYFRGTRIRATSDNGFYAAASGGSFSAITTIGDVIGIIFDIDNNYCAITVNGVIRVSSSSAGLSGYTWYPYSAGDGGGKAAANFGQKPFKFPPPAGFQPLALANTPRPTIVRPDQYVGVSTWVGNYPSSTNVNIGWKPDFVWLKSRTNATANLLFDTVRGATYYLSSNATDAESNSPSTTLTSFNDNGFTVGNNSTANGGNMVAWAWKAGGNSNTYNINDVGYATASTAGLTAGTITPTGASVNTKSGFSIITYNGAGTNSALTSTISHGLTQAPTFMIVKARTGTNAADDWFVYHKSIGPTKRTRLNLTNAADTQTWMGDTEPTSSLITLNQGWYSVNYTGHTHILYAWAEIPGFSKFGSYTGNGSADGPMVITGFRPRWIMIKRTDSADDWNIFDTTRSTYNVMGHDLLANRPDAEYTGTYIDSLSNGFKVRETNSSRNASGGTYIYAAFAETPTQNLYGAQANAR